MRRGIGSTATVITNEEPDLHPVGAEAHRPWRQVLLIECGRLRNWWSKHQNDESGLCFGGSIVGYDASTREVPRLRRKGKLGGFNGLRGDEKRQIAYR